MHMCVCVSMCVCVCIWVEQGRDARKSGVLYLCRGNLCKSERGNKLELSEATKGKVKNESLNGSAAYQFVTCYSSRGVWRPGCRVNLSRSHDSFYPLPSILFIAAPSSLSGHDDTKRH